jgi:hypothetical protein
MLLMTLLTWFARYADRHEDARYAGSPTSHISPMTPLPHYQLAAPSMFISSHTSIY